jgi:hypothetical protein
LSLSEDIPTGFKEYNGCVPSRVDPKSVYTNEAGEIYHAEKLNGVYKDATGWHIREGPCLQRSFINYRNRWQGLTYFNKGGYTKKNKAHYMRVRPGLLLGQVNKERIDFLTLSTKYDIEKPEDRLKRMPKLNYAFTKLKQQIEYYWQKKRYLKFCHQKHLKPFEIHNRKKSVKYPEYWAMFRSKLRYVKVKTSEGGGVLHIIFRKSQDYPPIPKRWLHKQWLKIWGSWNTSIKEVPYSDVDRMSHYVVGKYFVNQPIVRLSYGHEWVFSGFVKSFHKIIDTYVSMRQPNGTPEKHKPFKRAIEVWNKNIKSGCLPKNSCQRSIFGCVGKDNKWHSKRKNKPKIDLRGVCGLDFNVALGLHYHWWNCRLDSPKYVGGFHFVMDNMLNRSVVYNLNTVIVDR